MRERLQFRSVIFTFVSLSGKYTLSSRLFFENFYSAGYLMGLITRSSKKTWTSAALSCLRISDRFALMDRIFIILWNSDLEKFVTSMKRRIFLRETCPFYLIFLRNESLLFVPWIIIKFKFWNRPSFAFFFEKVLSKTHVYIISNFKNCLYDYIFYRLI